MKSKPRSKYFSFLLRLWQEEVTGPWRATLENPHNGERYGFSRLDKLYDFLDEKTINKIKEEINDEE